MTDKNITKKRILIYLSLAFIPPWILQFIYLAVIGRDVDNAYYQLLMSVSMLFPAVGNILTRIITKEGFKNSFLKVNLKGNVGYYLTAIFLPVVYALISVFVISVGFMPEGSTSEILRGTNLLDIITLALFLAAVSSLVSVLAFGEELGWRGYLTPKLEEILGTPAALVISGIIWGFWHAPAIVIGHNLGTDYKFYPFSGILLMCIFCVFMGIYFSALTKKTSSVYPAALAHAGNNNISGTFMSTLFVSANASSHFFDEHGTLIGITISVIGSLIALIASIIISANSQKSEILR